MSCFIWLAKGSSRSNKIYSKWQHQFNRKILISTFEMFEQTARISSNPNGRLISETQFQIFNAINETRNAMFYCLQCCVCVSFVVAFQQCKFTIACDSNNLGWRWRWQRQTHTNAASHYAIKPYTCEWNVECIKFRIGLLAQCHWRSSKLFHPIFD